MFAFAKDSQSKSTHMTTLIIHILTAAHTSPKPAITNPIHNFQYNKSYTYIPYCNEHTKINWCSIKKITNISHPMRICKLQYAHTELTRFDHR